MPILSAGGLPCLLPRPAESFGVTEFPILPVRVGAAGCGAAVLLLRRSSVVSLFRLHLRTLAPLRVTPFSPAEKECLAGCVWCVEYFCTHLFINNVERALRKSGGLLLPCFQASKPEKFRLSVTHHETYRHRVTRVRFLRARNVHTLQGTLKATLSWLKHKEAELRAQKLSILLQDETEVQRSSNLDRDYGERLVIFYLCTSCLFVFCEN